MHLGERLEPEEFRDKVNGAQAKHPEEATAYLYLTMSTMAEIAALLGEPYDEYEKAAGELTHAEAGYKSLYGEVKSRWEATEKGLKYTISIPANCTAEIRLPGGKTEHVKAGSYTFEEARA